MMELGRIRLGDKGDKGQPQKLSKFRLTSASRVLLDAAAKEYGGTVKPWRGAPDEGYFELYTEADTLDVIIPPVFSTLDGTPTAPYSQYYELWSGGGCQRRCDGAIEALSGKPCLCDPETRACKITTRVSVMLPKVPGIGVWRLETHGWNAASVLPGTLEFLNAASGGGYFNAELRLEQRSSKKDGQTRRFVVPVIDIPQLRVADLTTGNGSPLAINAPVPAPPKPELPAGPKPPDDPAFTNDEPEHGPQPDLPDAPDPDVISQAQRRLLFGLARENGLGEEGLREIVKEITGDESTGGMSVSDFETVKAEVERVATG
jgi:hypothetical protein